MSESDGINEIFDDLLRQALMLAARLGEQAARARQQHIERARAQSKQAGREAVARFDAERQATRLALAPVQQGRWWESATPEQIGAAYQSATAWANEDSDIARTRRIMDEQLAQRGVIVTGSESGQVTALVQAKQWAAEKNPLLDSLHTREMVNSANPRDRERLNNQLVGAWLARPDAAPAKPAYQGSHEAPMNDGYANPLTRLTSSFPDDVYEHPDWYGTADQETLAQLRSVRNDPEALVTIYRAVPEDHQEINTGDWVTLSREYAEEHASRVYDDVPGVVLSYQVPASQVFTDGNDLAEYGWTGAKLQQAARAAEHRLSSESEKLRNAAYFKEAAAAGARGDGAAAASRADDLHSMTPLDMETGPTSADAEWYAQEAAKADALAAEKWDTAERREEFAQSLHGKADQVAVDARVLADVSQGTHPSAAVKGAAPSATKARKNNHTPRSQSISKGGR